MAGELNYKAGLDISNFIKSRDEILKSFKQLKDVGGVSLFDNKPLTAFKQAQLRMQESLRDARLETQRLKNEQLELKKQLEAGKVTAQAYRTETAKLTAQQAALRSATKLARDSQGAVNGSYKEAQSRLAALGREIRNTTGGFTSQSPALKAQIREYNELNDKLKSFDASMGNHQRNVGNYGGVLGGVVGKLSGLAAGFLSAQALLTSSFDTALRTDAIKTSLEFTFDSVDVAKEKMDGLRATSERLGLEYIGLADAYRAFAGAAVASNFPLTETDRIFNAVANAGAKLKLSSDQVSGALTALQQMISKGNVQAEELRGQLGERLPGAFAIAARAMGVTQQELGELMKAGKITADELLPKLATELDKTFKNDTTEKVSSLQGAVNRLKNAFTEVVETKGAVSAFFEFVVDKAGATVRAIGVLSKALGIFYDLASDPKKLIGDSARDSRNKTNTAITSKANSSASTVAKDLGKSELVDRINAEVTALRRINAEYEKSKKVYESVRASDRSLADTKRIQAVEANLKYQQAFVTGLKNEFGTLFPAIQKSTRELSSIAAIRAEITRLSKMDGSATKGSDSWKKIQDLKTQLKEAAGTSDNSKSEAREHESMLKRQRALQSEIETLHVNAVKKQKTQDEQEIEAVEIKYDAIRKKIADFYSDPRNTGRQYKVNVSTVNKDQSIETENILADQRLKKEQQTIDAQKVLFKEYEQYKLEVGVQMADDRFSSDLKGYKTFVDYLKGLMPSEKDTSAYANRMRDMLSKTIPAATNEQSEQQEKRFSQLLVDTQSFETQRNLLIERYTKQASDLRAKGYDNQAAMAIAYGNKELEQFDSNTIQQIEGYRFLFEGFTRMSTEAIDQYIQKAKQKADTDLALGLITQKAYDQVIEAINNSKGALNSAIPTQLRGFAQIFKDLASSTDGLSKGLTNVLNILGDMVNAAADVKQGISDTKSAIANYKDNKADAGGGLLGTLSAGLAIAGPAGKAISAVVGVVKGITGFFKAAKESAKQAAAELQAYQDNAFKGEIAYNQLLRERARTMKSIGDLSLSELKTQQAILAAQKGQSQTDADRLLAKIRLSGQQITGTHIEKKGGFLGIGKKSYTVQDTAGLAGATYEQLEELYTRGKLTDATKAWFEELKKAKEETDGIVDAAKEAQNAINQALTGTTANSIADAIINGFKQGKRTAADFADDFKTLMSDAMYRALSEDFLNEAIAEFYKKFAEASKDGLTETEIKTLRDSYAGIIQEGARQAENIEKVIGPSAASSGTKPTGITAEIADKITQQQASELAGLYRAQYDVSKKTMAYTLDGNKVRIDCFNIARQHLEVAVQNERNTFRTANNTERLAAMEASLKAIANNTYSQSSRALL
jgi:tape measure domain-containing protein